MNVLAILLFLIHDKLGQKDFAFLKNAHALFTSGDRPILMTQMKSDQMDG